MAMVKLRVSTKKRNAKSRVARYVERVEEAKIKWGNPSTRVEMIQSLIPLGLMAVESMLQAEVASLAGCRYARGYDGVRWGSNPGSIFLGEQKVSVRVPRVRHRESEQEMPLESYAAFQNPHYMDERLFGRVLQGVSARRYEDTAAMVPEVFGIKKSSVSRHFIRACSAKLKELTERGLSAHDIVAIFIDGKHFADNEIIIALGVTMTGEKIFLGFTEASSEHATVCREFLRDMLGRGLSIDNEILFIIDGSKGLRKGIKTIMGDKAFIQRCQWHKRENVLSYLNDKDKPRWKRTLHQLFDETDEAKRNKYLPNLNKELKMLNESAFNSLQEGLDEIMTVHSLGLPKELRIGLRTTNPIENVNSLLGQYTDRVDHWKTSNQRQRWVATALLEVEPRLRRIRGFQALGKLREAMKQAREKALGITSTKVAKAA
jgi:transposase-like protein